MNSVLPGTFMHIMPYCILRSEVLIYFLCKCITLLYLIKELILCDGALAARALDSERRGRACRSPLLSLLAEQLASCWIKVHFYIRVYKLYGEVVALVHTAHDK